MSAIPMAAAAGEMCLQMHSLDRDLGDFLGLMDRSGIDYAVVLTADHGVLDIPERTRLKGVATAKRSRPDLTAAAIGKAIGARLGLAGPVLIGEGAHGDMYLDKALSPADRRRAQAAAVAAFRADPEVEAVFTREQLARTAVPTSSPDRWSLIERVRAGFDPARSGDFIVLLKRDITPIPNPSGGYVATHGSPWDYDRRVPILFWRPGSARNERPEHVATVDIMPTLAAMLALPVDASAIDGRCLASAAVGPCPTR